MQGFPVNDSANTEGNRLVWQCRRGMRELDELLGHFLRTGYSRLDTSERQQFIRLLDYPDSVLLEILMGRMAPADTDVANLVREIRSALAP
jgi:antitoxin CptB